MKIITNIAILLVAALHAGFLALEMFFWDHPFGREVFSMTPEQSAETAVLAANQGLYNGFLAAGLLWGLIASKRDVTFFFLSCVIVAGVYGALTASFSILYLQAMPAMAAFALMVFARSE